MRLFTFVLTFVLFHFSCFHELCRQKKEDRESRCQFYRRAGMVVFAGSLADPKVEAVIVAIADQFHVDAAIQALKAGKHMLVERPLGTSVADCQRLAAEVREA